ncbi:DNA-processing protein DprA [bacterium]|nr:DNA-processing protein DprA [bacterium]MBU1880477.1 DNA-processing protein DprA [bacterium]
MNEAEILLRLLRLPDIGPVAVRKLAARLETKGKSLSEIDGFTDHQLATDFKMTEAQIEALRHPQLNASEDLKECRKQGIVIITQRDLLYPFEKLLTIGKAQPALLFLKGNIDLLKQPAMAISGARNADEGSLQMVDSLCEKLASEGWVIVSGGARGVDEVAHLAALRKGPGTILVMPTGFFRPNFRDELKKRLDEKKTLLISEFPPEQGWAHGTAMMRNQLIAALSRGVVLVEPGKRGGTGGTGKLTQKMGVPLYILQTDQLDNEVADKFIKKKAALIQPGDMKNSALTNLLLENWVRSEEQRRSHHPDLFK